MELRATRTDKPKVQEDHKKRLGGGWPFILACLNDEKRLPGAVLMTEADRSTDALLAARASVIMP